MDSLEGGVREMTDPLIESLKARNYNAPRCPDPKCNRPCGTPSQHTEQGRWYGPAASRIWCPACGTGWYGTDAELAQAESAWQAYELLVEMGVM